MSFHFYLRFDYRCPSYIECPNCNEIVSEEAETMMDLEHSELPIMFHHCHGISIVDIEFDIDVYNRSSYDVKVVDEYSEKFIDRLPVVTDVIFPIDVYAKYSECKDDLEQKYQEYKDSIKNPENDEYELKRCIKSKKVIFDKKTNQFKHKISYLECCLLRSGDYSEEVQNTAPKLKEDIQGNFLVIKVPLINIEAVSKPMYAYFSRDPEFKFTPEIIRELIHDRGVDQDVVKKYNLKIVDKHQYDYIEISADDVEAGFSDIDSKEDSDSESDQVLTKLEKIQKSKYKLVPMFGYDEETQTDQKDRYKLCFPPLNGLWVPCDDSDIESVCFDYPKFDTSIDGCYMFVLYKNRQNEYRTFYFHAH